MAISTLEVVQKWHAALNAGQTDQMVALVHPQVEVGGPRGSTRGVQALLDWFGRANIRLLPQRWFDGGNQIVVQELGQWRAPESDQVTSSQLVASVFRVSDDGLITRIWRHDDLAPALEDVCLSLEDEVELD